jgi:plexin A
LEPRNETHPLILKMSTAFAELQTDMRDLTADLGASAIPTLDHKNYVMKVFFPGVTEHPILRDPKVCKNNNIT